MHEHEHPLDATALEAYAEDGAIPLHGVVTGPLLERLQAAARRMRNRAGGFWYNIYLWREDPDFRACCMDSPLPEIAARLLATPKVNLLYDQLFIKAPSGEPTPWHHDLPYWPVEGTAVASIWLALSEVTPENGGLEFIRGSHRWARPTRTFTVNRETGAYSAATPTAGQEPAPDFDRERGRFDIVSWPLGPGDAVAFHALTFHHAPGNTTTGDVRTGYALRFMGDAVRYREEEGMNPRVFNPELADGDVMDSEQYPVVFPRPVTQATVS